MSVKNDDSRGSGSTNWWLLGVLAVCAWGGWIWVRDDWWPVHGVVASQRLRLVGLVVSGGFLLLVLVLWVVSRRSAAGGVGLGGGWGVGDREVFAVVPSSGAARRARGVGPRRPGEKKRGPARFWGLLLRQGVRLSGSGRVLRVLWGRDGGGRLVWGVSVDGGLAASARRAAADVWPAAVVEDWPLTDALAAGDGDDGGAVVRRYLVPEDLGLPLGVPDGSPDHPMALVGDVLAAHGEVDVQLRLDLVPLSPSVRDGVCAGRLEAMGDWDPDRQMWENSDRRGVVCGVRVLLRVSRPGLGNSSECTEVADRICEVLDTFWSTDHNRLVGREVPDEVFDRMWETGALEKDFPVYHYDCWRVLLEPPPPKLGKTAGRRLPDPPVLETYDPANPGRLMPIGIMTEPGGDRMVGVPWGGATDPLVDWIVGGTGSGKSYHSVVRVVALAQTGRGFLYIDPHRSTAAQIKEYLAAGHADRILEIDLQATNSVGEPVSAGWNPLDLHVVPEVMRKGRIDNLRGMLPVALFPDYFAADSKAPQTRTIIRKAIEGLLHLNSLLPARIQANLFCIENLLLDEQWRNLVVSQLPDRYQKWWHDTFGVIVGDKGASSAALKPALNALEQWKSQDRIQALLGASQSTLHWREIIDQEKILLVMLNNDGGETDRLLSRLIIGEMVTAFKERNLTQGGENEVKPYHLFLDEFQTYAQMLAPLIEVIVQELRKNGVKAHFINQSPAALVKIAERILANCTHLFSGPLGNPSDADIIAKAMGAQKTPRQADNTPAGIQRQDLLNMPRWHFVCQVTLNGKRSKPFLLKGIDAQKLWGHLRTGQDITAQIAENTGLEPVEQRLEHYDTLPERIAHWLQTNNPNTTRPANPRQPATPEPADDANRPRHDTATRSDSTTNGKPRAGSPGKQDNLRRWADECVIKEPRAVTPAAAFVASYMRWCAQHGTQPLPERQVHRYLNRCHGPTETVRIRGKVTRAHRGLKLAKTRNA